MTKEENLRKIAKLLSGEEGDSPLFHNKRTFPISKEPQTYNSITEQFVPDDKTLMWLLQLSKSLKNNPSMEMAEAIRDLQKRQKRMKYYPVRHKFPVDLYNVKDALEEWIRTDRNDPMNIGYSDVDAEQSSHPKIPSQAQVYQFLRRPSNYTSLIRTIKMGRKDILPFASTSHIIAPEFRIKHEDKQSLEDLFEKWFREENLFEFNEKDEVRRKDIYPKKGTVSYYETFLKESEKIVEDMDDGNNTSTRKNLITNRSNLYDVVQNYSNMWLLYEPKSFMNQNQWKMYPRLSVVLSLKDYSLINIMKETINFLQNNALEEDNVGCTFIAQPMSFDPRNPNRWYRNPRKVREKIRELDNISSDLLYHDLMTQLMSENYNEELMDIFPIFSSKSTHRLFQMLNRPVIMSSCDPKKIGLSIDGLKKNSIPINRDRSRKRRRKKSRKPRRPTTIQTFPKHYSDITLGKEQNTNRLITTRSLPLVPNHFIENLKDNKDFDQMVCCTWISYNTDVGDENEIDRFVFRMQTLMKRFDLGWGGMINVSVEDERETQVLNDLKSNSRIYKNEWIKGLTVKDPRWNGTERQFENFVSNLNYN
jgi:hypothetical protein